MDTTSPGSRDCFRQAIIPEIDPSKASTRAVKYRLNELAAISRLPCEVLAAIFSFLVFAWNEGSGHLAWIYVTHVCRRWRETALNHPRVWNRINLTKLTPVGMVEILSRAKMAPLHLEAASHIWERERLEAFETQLEAHISHTRHLKFSGYQLSTVIKRLESPTPILEYLSLSHSSHIDRLPPAIIPDNLFNCTAPSLTTLQLMGYDIDWKSPLLKGLRILEVLDLSARARPELNDWLDALNEMSQLKELSLRSATPVALFTNPLISRTVTLPSLTYFCINASAKDCALALTHLVLPTLTRLHVDIESHGRGGEDVLLMIPYVARYVCALQDIKPIRSILLEDRGTDTKVVTWTTPGADVKAYGLDDLVDMSRSACFLFAARGYRNGWKCGVNTIIFDALLTILPMNSISTLTVQNTTRFNKEFWLRHAPRYPLLEQARLKHISVRTFVEMLAEDTPSDSPRLPSLTRLILQSVTLSALKTYRLGNMLIKRVEQGVPLECLDLRKCAAAKLTTQLLTEIVLDVQEPLNPPPIVIDDIFFDWYEGSRYENELEFDDRQASDYWVTYERGREDV